MYKVKMQNNDSKKYILIDDDPIYQMIMLRFAKERAMDLEVYSSLQDLGLVGLLGRYDAAIVDYDLGNLNGVEIAEYLSALFVDIPMILVSEQHRTPGANAWPNSIKEFVCKSSGYDHVLTRALGVLPAA